MTIFPHNMDRSPHLPPLPLCSMPSVEVLGQLYGRINGVVKGGRCAVGVESTILDLTVTPYRVLRQGGLGREAIEAVLGREVEA